MATLTERLHEQCRAVITQRGMFMEDLLAALRLISGRSDGMISELMRQYGGLEQLLLNGLPFLQWDFSSAVFPTVGMTNTRAGDRQATVTDFEGIVWRCKANEMRLVGLRRAENQAPNSNSPQNATVNTFSPAPLVNSATAPDGTQTAWTIPLGATGFGQTNVTIPADNSGWILSLFVRATGPGARAFFVANGINTVDTTAANTTSFYDFDTNTFGAGMGVATATPVGGGWIRISKRFQNNGAGTVFLLRTDAQPQSAGLTAYSGWQLEAVPAGVTAPSEYVSNGVLSGPVFHGAFADGVRYFTTNRAGTPIAEATRLGLLIEQSATNSLLRSEQFDDVVWTKTEVTVTANGGVGPDGISSAENMVPTAVLGAHFVQQSLVRVASTPYTRSVYARANGYNFILIQCLDLAGVFQNARFNLQLGTVIGTTAGATATITPVGSSGWYRCTMSFNAGVGATAPNDAILFADTAANLFLNWSGNGTSGVLLWGAQEEPVAAATSYIPTTSAAVTRALDNTAVSPVPTFSTAAGTLFADYVSEGGTAVRQPALLNRLDDDLNNYIDIVEAPLGVTDTIGGRNRAAGVTDAQIVFTQAAGRRKVAFAYAPNDVGMSVNAQAPVVDTSAASPSFPTNRLQIGASFFSNFSLNNTIRAIRYYPSRLPNATLQSITA